ncbi:hypothetical protein T310_3744 [Rasamsonia emersonii CBS 393.64]|uniref:Uncharacterized protein n=1 Tax=Rasamsonia emersonii (strain ATCC 16479 / CBS 393.64 / IMI 116815) TaxID=1408163 RepID=A0A0F4YWL6_RASE3|nr:hypothetical protein T310_3744 [Rasamsonia emersonii CBS 393.64]KKA22226.1 hypothetical protein T310_3744 [Rasamsonia emersonii CBS 393.64]
MSANRAPAAIPYDLRKKHIPRIPSPAPNQDPAGNYTPMAAARKIRKMRQKKASEASRASGARSSAERPQAKAPASKNAHAAPVGDASDDAPVDTPANAPDEVSDLQESVDNESPREPPAEDEEEEAARALYTTKERFKKLVYKRRVEEARRRLQEAEEDTYIPTSDIEEEMDELLRAADYPVALYLRIYLNKTLVVRKALPDSTRRTLDIADIEEIFLQSLQPFVKDEDYEVISRTAIVRLATGRGGSKAHDIDDFTNAEAEQILALLDRQHKTFPRSQIQLHFEIKVVCEALQGNKKKSRQSSQPPKQSTTDEASSPISSSPPVASTRSNRTGRLLEQHSRRLESIRIAGDFQRQLMERYRCLDDNCTNKNNYCFPDPTDPNLHYNITAAQHEMWANSIASGEATLQQPPYKLIRYWEREQGPITRQSRQPFKAVFPTANQDSNGAPNGDATADAEQMLQARMMDQLEAMEEKQERREERNERRQMQREQRELLLQQQQLLLQPHLQSLYNPLRPLLGRQDPPNLSAPLRESTPVRPKSSSPIDANEDDADILAAFFDWKINNTKNPERKAKWEHAKQTVMANDWSIQELQQMEDGSCAMYQRAIKAGISDGFARGFKSELHKFKDYYRHLKEETKAAMALDQLVQGGGGFIPGDTF